MPPRKGPVSSSNAAHSYARLEQRLSLLSWLHDLLGYSHTKQLLDDIRPAQEGFDGDGRSHVVRRLMTREGLKISTMDLERYDDNIREHLAALNEGRTDPITLRYFQYLAALYTELYLDQYHKSSVSLLAALNEHVKGLNSKRRAGERVELFENSNLKKLAYWMATGSGKTLLMHLNFRQYLHYNQQDLDNILLITPNEGLTQQHLEELEASSISARRFDLNESPLFQQVSNSVVVIDIHKLVSEKRGQGVTVPVEVFEGNNLVFVDEGHKGSGGEAWREVRDTLGQRGFTFEYSATFGQALTAAHNDALTAEYGKAIAFDYSYRFFYDDGYGKDFHIVNLQRETSSERTDTLLLANLLSFYEQQLVFADKSDELRPYNLDQPLWLFVGRSVNAVGKVKGRPSSDVLTVARFFHRVLSEPLWTIETIRQLLEGDSGLVDDYGIDVFQDKYPYLLKEGKPNASSVYQDMLARTLHAPSGGGLHIADIRGSTGELGLKGSGATDYFGLIYIGDTPAFKKLVTSDDAGITVEEDALADSLFAEIGQADTTIETLIGSRKFIEGWNSWRVSNMGILNMGTSEGSEIIQLFGRGVRLRGREMTLKRSSAPGSNGNHPEHIGLLETLNIFAVRANYMAQFRDYLEREGVPTNDLLELPLFIRPNQEFLDKGLVIPRVDEARDFKSETQVELKYVERMQPVYLDVSARVQSMASAVSDIEETVASSGKETVIPVESLALVDWDKVLLSLMDYKEQKGMDNLIVRSSSLKEIIEAGPPAYQLVSDDKLTEPSTYEEWMRLEETVIAILRKYADKLYRRSREQWESGHLVYKILDDTDDNFGFNRVREDRPGRYIVRVQRTDQDIIEEIENLRANCHALYEQESKELPRIYFDRHLYQPLLLNNGNKQLRISPPGLTESERNFICGLRKHWRENLCNDLRDSEVFLLRNQGKGMGVGFFENSGFYPDFILWIKTGEAQRIVFVDPHGMVHEDAPEHSDKIQLYKRLRGLSNLMRKRQPSHDVTLDSYIVSATPYETLRKRWPGNWGIGDFAYEHILFQEPNDILNYLDVMIAGRCTNVGASA